MKMLNRFGFAQQLALAAAVAGVGFASGCASDPAAATPEVMVAFDDVLDDMEDGDDAILQRGFRIGYWYGFNDETAGGTQMPDPDNFQVSDGGADTTLHSARTWGTGFKEWGAGIGFDLNNKGDAVGGPSNRGVYDASAFKGVTFRAKGNTSIRFAVATEAVVEVEWKGTCAPSMVDGMMCDDTHGRTIAVSPNEWKRFVIPFQGLAQVGFGRRVPLDLTKVMALHFVTSENVSFDISIDDIGFYK
jgi:hypothetical protein